MRDACEHLNDLKMLPVKSGIDSSAVLPSDICSLASGPVQAYASEGMSGGSKANPAREICSCCLHPATVLILAVRYTQISFLVLLRCF
jgi:hypothetical protein